MNINNINAILELFKEQNYSDTFYISVECSKITIMPIAEIQSLSCEVSFMGDNKFIIWTLDGDHRKAHFIETIPDLLEELKSRLDITKYCIQRINELSDICISEKSEKSVSIAKAETSDEEVYYYAASKLLEKFIQFLDDNTFPLLKYELDSKGVMHFYFDCYQDSFCKITRWNNGCIILETNRDDYYQERYGDTKAYIECDRLLELTTAFTITYNRHKQIYDLIKSERDNLE
jgi:hypothetical protein